MTSMAPGSTTKRMCGRRRPAGRPAREGDPPRLARFEGHAREAGELLHRSGDAGHRVAQVELHDLVAARAPSLRSVERDRDVSVGGATSAGATAGRRTRSGVGEPVAERVERRGRHVDVVALPVRAPAGGLVAVVDGDLRRVAGERDRQLAAGLSSPKSTAATACRPRRRAARRPGSRRRARPGRRAPSGRPPSSTSTTGVPVAATASTSASWTPGRRTSARSRASPQVASFVRPERSPTTTTATSAARPAATASSKPRCRRRRRRSRGRAAPCGVGPTRARSPASRLVMGG
jgi:hypothetical protein